MSASDATVGDIEKPTLVVAGYDTTTSAELVVSAPDGTTTNLTATPEDDTPTAGEQTWTTNQPVTFDQPGRWVLTWTISGKGAGVEVHEVYVTAHPLPGGPTWMPGRSRPANYVWGRTLARDLDTHQLTFDSSTLPTGAQVDRIIADAVAWIRATVAQVPPPLHETAATAAALWAAAAIERGWPTDNPEQALNRAKDLQQQADQLLQQLAHAAAYVDQPSGPLLPIWSFPDPVPWGDTNF